MVWLDRINQISLSTFFFFSLSPPQALGLLYWHKYNIEKAVEDLPNFCPLQGEGAVHPIVHTCILNLPFHFVVF